MSRRESLDNRYKRRYVGHVVRASNHKTITVTVERQVIHPLYKKLIRSTKRYQVHDEHGVAAIDDRVEIQECRPISRHKHFRLIRVISHGAESHVLDQQQRSARIMAESTRRRE